MITKLNKILIFIALVQISSMSFAKIAYSEDDLEQFNKTNYCINCDLSNATLEGKENAVLDGAILIESFITGPMVSSSYINAVLTQIRSDRTSGFCSMVSNFQGAIMTHAKFHNAHLSGSNFENADLSKSDFSEANLSSTNFTGANVFNVNFDNAILVGSNLTQEQLKKAKSYFCAILPDGTLTPPENDWENC